MLVRQAVELFPSGITSGFLTQQSLCYKVISGASLGVKADGLLCFSATKFPGLAFKLTFQLLPKNQNQVVVLERYKIHLSDS